MSGQTQREEVLAIIAKELRLDPAAMTGDISVETVELWDSVAHTEIIFALEAKFGFEFTQEETEEMYSVDEILSVMSKRGVHV